MATSPAGNDIGTRPYNAVPPRLLPGRACVVCTLLLFWTQPGEVCSIKKCPCSPTFCEAALRDHSANEPLPVDQPRIDASLPPPSRGLPRGVTNPPPPRAADP